MKISEIMGPKIASSINPTQTQDLVPQDPVAMPAGSAIAEGIKRILRRVKGKGLKQGFRCTDGPRKGRIVANPGTCNARLQPLKGAKIAQKRQRVAKQTAIKRARTMRAGGASRRLSAIQVGRHGGTAPLKKGKKLKKSPSLKKKQAFQKSKIINPKKK